MNYFINQMSIYMYKRNYMLLDNFLLYISNDYSLFKMFFDEYKYNNNNDFILKTSDDKCLTICMEYIYTHFKKIIFRYDEIYAYRWLFTNTNIFNRNKKKNILLNVCEKDNIEYFINIYKYISKNKLKYLYNICEYFNSKRILDFINNKYNIHNDIHINKICKNKIFNNKKYFINI